MERRGSLCARDVHKIGLVVAVVVLHEALDGWCSACHEVLKTSLGIVTVAVLQDAMST